MTQTRTMSLIETIAQTVAGFVIAFWLQVIVFPLYGVHTSYNESLQIAAIFTIASLIRGYLVRRLFCKINTQ